MAQNAAIDRNAGSGGFDWAFHQYDTVGADDDMAINNNLLGLELPVIVNRDRWQETEADSGSAFADVIKGTEEVPSEIGGAGFTGCDVLDQAGVDRIHGLAALLPPLTGDPAPVIARSAAGACPLEGPIWGDGNILLGGAGSDSITGRGGDDIIDGDQSLSVRISVRTDPADPSTEIGSADLMEHRYLRDSSGALTGPTLQAAVFAGTVDPANLVIVREIVSPPAGTDNAAVDTAVFAGPRGNYEITFTPGRVVVTQTGANVEGQRVSDGVDIIRNVEKLRFSDQTVTISVPAAPTNVTATAGNASATVRWTRAVTNGGPAVTSNEIVISSNGSVVQTIRGLAAGAVTRTITGLTNGTPYTFQVRAVNIVGAGPLSAPTPPVTPGGLPAAPTAVTAVRGNASASLTWTDGNDGGSPILSHQVEVRRGTTIVRTDSIPGSEARATITGLTNGTAYNFRVRAVSALGAGTQSASSNAVTPATVPGAPAIQAPTRGTAGGALTAVAHWNAPAGNGGAAIQNYRVTARRMAADGVTEVGASVVATVGAGARNHSFTLAAGTYRFDVIAINAIGDSDPSARSATVVPR
jgi:hypothetical protein